MRKKENGGEKFESVIRPKGIKIETGQWGARAKSKNGSPANGIAAPFLNSRIAPFLKQNTKRATRELNF